MDARLLAIVRLELRDAARSKWLWALALATAAVMAGVGAPGLSTAAGTVAFSRTIAAFVNLSLLLVPSLGLLLGAQALTNERERRTLAYLLAQPVTRSQVLIGKYLGLGLALLAAILAGLGATGLVLSTASLDATAFARVVGLTVLLGLASLSVGLLISVLARRMMVAVAAAACVWFSLTLLGDLGLLGTALATRLRTDAVLVLALLNPAQVFKIGAIQAVRPDLEVLGPAGLLATASLGPWLAPVLFGLLAAWVVLPLILATFVFSRSAEV